MLTGTMSPLQVQQKDLPQLLGLSWSTIQREINKGNFPPCTGRVGGRRLWRMADLEEWVSNGCKLLKKT